MHVFRDGKVEREAHCDIQVVGGDTEIPLFDGSAIGECVMIDFIFGHKQGVGAVSHLDTFHNIQLLYLARHDVNGDIEIRIRHIARV